MRISLTLGGSEELAKRMAALPDKLRHQTLVRALEIAGLPILQRMEQLAPFDPQSEGPHLKHNLGMTSLRSWDGQKRHEHEAAIGIGPAKFLRHGGFQELGTAEHPPQPYMRPAWDEKGGSRAQSVVAGELWTALKAGK